MTWYLDKKKEPWTLAQIQLSLGPRSNCLWSPPPSLHQLSNSGHPFWFRNCWIADEFGPSSRSSHDIRMWFLPGLNSAEISISCWWWGFYTHKCSILSLCHSTLCQERGNSSACKSMPLACRVLCCFKCGRQHHRANSSVRVPVPLITSHLWLAQISPRHWWESPGLHQSRRGGS